MINGIVLLMLPQAFYPKTRGRWKAHSSWEAPEKIARGDETMIENRWPAEVKIKKGFSWSEELAIAIKCLIEDEKASLIDWTKEVRAHYMTTNWLF